MDGTQARWDATKHDPRIAQIRQAEKEANALPFTIGLLLCLTGIGAIVGIPMILVSLFANKRPDIAPTGAWLADCPHCATSITFTVTAEQPVFRCPTCLGAIELKEGRLLKSAPEPTENLETLVSNLGLSRKPPSELG